MNTTRSKIESRKPLLEATNPWLKGHLAIHACGKTRQRDLEGNEAWAIGGQSLHWQPATADEDPHTGNGKQWP